MGSDIMFLYKTYNIELTTTNDLELWTASRYNNTKLQNAQLRGGGVP